MQPVHVPRLEVFCGVIVERRIDGARAEPVGNRQKAELPESSRKGERKHRKRRQKNAQRGDERRADPRHELIGKERRDNGGKRDDEADDARGREGSAQLRVHDGPGGTEEGIGQPERDECEIDDGNKKACHVGSAPCV